MLKFYIPERRGLAPLYENSNTPVALFYNSDEVLDLGNVTNELVRLTKILIIPQFDSLVYKTTSYGLSVIAGSDVVEKTLDNLPTDASCFLKELDIYYKPKELEIYSLKPDDVITNPVLNVRVELTDLSDLTYISHLLTHSDITKIYIRKGKDLSQVSTTYLEGISTSDIDAIVLESDLPVDNVPIKKLFNYLVVQVSKYVKRIANTYPSIYEYSALRYGKDVFTPITTLSDLGDARLKYIVNSDYIYLL